MQGSQRAHILETLRLTLARKQRQLEASLLKRLLEQKGGPVLLNLSWICDLSLAGEKPTAPDFNAEEFLFINECRPNLRE